MISWLNLLILSYLEIRQWMELHQTFRPAITTLSPDFIKPLLANIFPTKLTTNVPNKILKNPSLCHYVLI